MSFGKLTGDEKVNHRIALVVADLIIKIVCGEASVPQAVAMVDKFADSLRGKVSDEEVSVARAYVMEFIFSTTQGNRAEEEAKKARAADGGIESLLQTMRKAFLNGSISLSQAMGFADQAADVAKKAGLSEDGLYRLKAHMSEFLLACQVEKEQQGTQRQPATRSKIRWFTDPREIGLNIPWNPEDVPWQKRQPWATIKTYLPPAMIDTPEKEESVAWRIGFLLGYGAERAAMAAIREFGLAGGAATMALFAWAYDTIKRNS